MIGIYMPYHPSDLKSRLDMYPKGHRGYATPGVDYGPGGFKAGTIERPVVASERALDRRIGMVYGQKAGDKDPFHETKVKTRMVRKKNDPAAKAQDIGEMLKKKARQLEAMETAQKDRMADAKDPRNGKRAQNNPQGWQEMIAKHNLRNRKLKAALAQYAKKSAEKSDFNYKDHEPSERHKNITETSVQSQVKYTRAQLGLQPYKSFKMNPERVVELPTTANQQDRPLPKDEHK
jgi:hypothetical protein